MIQILRIQNLKIQIKDLKPKINKLRDNDQVKEKYRLTNFMTFIDQHKSYLFYKLKWMTHAPIPLSWTIAKPLKSL